MEGRKTSNNHMCEGQVNTAHSNGIKFGTGLVTFLSGSHSNGPMERGDSLIPCAYIQTVAF